MKLKIFITNLVWPLSFVSILFWPPTDRLSIRLLVCVILIAFILIIALRKKFLSKFTITSDEVRINFLNGVCIGKAIHWRPGDISEVKLIEARPLYGKPAILHIKVGGKSFDFSIIDRRVFEEVSHTIATTDQQLNKPLSPMITLPTL